jgi:hypothetical protein
MAVSLRFIPGSTIRWRERRFVVVDYAGMDAIVAREVGSVGFNASQPTRNSEHRSFPSERSAFSGTSPRLPARSHDLLGCDPPSGAKH